jgi:archaellum component FlaC
MDLEELHRVVVQGFASVHDRIDGVNDRIDAVNDRIDAVNERIDDASDRLDSGLAAVNARFDAVDAEFGQVKDALMEHGRQLKDIRSALDRKVDRDELEAQH